MSSWTVGDSPNQGVRPYPLPRPPAAAPGVAVDSPPLALARRRSQYARMSALTTALVSPRPCAASSTARSSAKMRQFTRSVWRSNGLGTVGPFIEIVHRRPREYVARVRVQRVGEGANGADFGVGLTADFDFPYVSFGETGEGG